MRLEARSTETGKMPMLQHFIPLALIFKHDLAEEPNRRHAVIEQLVVKLLQ